MEKIPMTRRGFDLLDGELKTLKSVERPAVIRAIAEAREHGDLSENAEYHAARERQSFIEGRIKELESLIGRAEVIDTTRLSGSIKFGATVTPRRRGNRRGAHLSDRRGNRGRYRKRLAQYPLAACARADRQG
jgi:transcription elongation GreA/GreB family factor